MPTAVVSPTDKVAPGQVVLWEQHPDHPGGEIWIKGGDAPIVAGLTSLVLERLHRGLLAFDAPANDPHSDDSESETPVSPRKPKGKPAKDAT